jgi:hypothetical protein
MSTDSIGPVVEVIETQLRDTIKRIHIDLPDQCDAVERAHALVRRSPQKPAQLLVIEAERSLGKTRVLDIISGNIQSAYVPRVKGWTCRTECTSGTDGRALGLLLCHELQVPLIGLGNLPRLGQYICKKIEKRSPVLLAVDNAHLLMKDGVPNTSPLEILGAIIASGVVPVILSGRTDTSTVAKHLMEMVGQIMEVSKLSPLPYTKGADLGRIRDFLLVVEADLFPLLNQIGIRITLGTDDFAKRFWAASWGSPGDILMLVLESLITIVRSRAEKRQNSRYSVKREDFAEAWRLLIARDSPLKFNPFKRFDAPTLGDIQDAQKRLEQNKQKDELQLPTAPKGKGAMIWR